MSTVISKKRLTQVFTIFAGGWAIFFLSDFIESENISLLTALPAGYMWGASIRLIMDDWVWVSKR